MVWNAIRGTVPACIDNVCEKSTPPKLPAVRRRSVLLALACLAAGLGGCTSNPPGTVAQNLGDYLNLRNSFLNPAEVGRFDKASPWGDVHPTKWPILQQLDVIEEPSDRWASATDPTPADVAPDNKEYILGTGDTVRITVFELVQPGQDYIKDVVIGETGTINIQNLGAVPTSGLTASQLEEKIGQMAVERNLLLPKGNGSSGPQVSVSLLQSRARVFSILGAVGQPGSYNILGNDFRLLDAIALARDIPVQPGMDYIYVIRQVSYKGAENGPATAPAPAVGGAVPPVTGPSAFEDIESIERSAKTRPATGPSTVPATAPASGPASVGPQFVRSISLAAVMPGRDPAPVVVAAADLDAAISGTVVTPATPASATAPEAPATSAVTTTTTRPGEELLNSALNPPSPQKGGNYVFLDGKWVFVPATTTAPAAGVAAATIPPVPALTMPAETAPAENPEKLSQQRVIRVPINALREGVPRYNIIIRAGDVINVPAVEPGEFYIMGNVSRPGVYTLTGRKITLKMAVASAGNLGPLAVPRRCEVIRRIGSDQEAIVMVNLQAVFDGEQPDIFLKPNDVVNVGTDMIQPFLAVTRNAYRLSYGFGFVYDRNYAPQQATH
jgi:polysaccharide biosynthesis/export protein